MLEEASYLMKLEVNSERNHRNYTHDQRLNNIFLNELGGMAFKIPRIKEN